MNKTKIMVGIAVVAMGVSANADGGVSLPKYAPNREITGAYDRTAAAVCENGTFVGEKMGDVIAYRGVPFAQQPVGKLRWKKALPPLPSNRVYEARHFGKACMQISDPVEQASLYEQGEECLTLCVYRNASDPEPGKPVMVFIHGGGWGQGGNCDPIYDGTRFVAQNPDVILVTVAYRFGLMGNVNFSQLPDGKDYAGSENLALLDQIAALKWLQRNVAAFGGDPKRVTIFGESAGGASVSALVLSAEARQCFRRAIPMSGAANFVQSARYDLTQALMKAFGAKSVADLVKVDFRALRDFWVKEGMKHYNLPTRDGVVLPEDPIAAWADPALKEIDVMQGVMRNELRFIIQLFSYDLEFARLVDRTFYELIAEGSSKAYREDAERLVRVLERDHGKDWAYSEFGASHIFRAGQLAQALAHAKNGGKEFFYRIDKCEDGPYGKLLGACHGAELAYLFGNLGHESAPDTEENRRFARMLQRMWVNFAKTGDPSLPDVAWPAFDAQTRKVMVLAGEGPHVEENPEGERTDLEQRLLGENPKFRFIKGLSPVFGRIIETGGLARYEAVMRKKEELAAEVLKNGGK